MKLSVAILNIHNLAFTKDTTLYEVEIEDRCIATTPNAYCYLTHTASRIAALSSDNVVNILGAELEADSYPQAVLETIDANLRLTNVYDVCHDALQDLLNPNQYAPNFLYLKRGNDILSPIVTEGAVSINPKDSELTMIPTTCSIVEALYAASVYGSDCDILSVTPSAYGIGIYSYGEVEYQSFYMTNNPKRLAKSHKLTIEEITNSIKGLYPYLNLYLLHLLQSYVASYMDINDYGYIFDSMNRWKSFLKQYRVQDNVCHNQIIYPYYKDILARLTCGDIEKRAMVSRYTYNEILKSDQMFLSAKDYIILGTKMLTEEGEGCIVLSLIPKDNTNIIPRNLGYKCKDFYKAILSVARTYDALNFYIFFDALEFYEFNTSLINTTHIKELGKISYCDNVLKLFHLNL